MPNAFLERYQRGERREVWSELVALGSDVRGSTCLKNASAVAAETMKRARQNVEAIIRKLTQLGYQFAGAAANIRRQMEMEARDRAARLESLQRRIEQLKSPDFKPGLPLSSRLEYLRQFEVAWSSLSTLRQEKQERDAAALDSLAKQAGTPPIDDPAVFQAPTKGVARALNRFERDRGGPMPLSLRAWFEQVGSVNLMGIHEALNPEFGATGPDPLVVYPCPFSNFDACAEAFGPDVLVISPDDIHKANNSGGDPYCMQVVDPVADARLLNQWRQTTFVDYLRTAFSWGGFPGWERSSNRPEKELSFLREGLLEI